MILMIDNYDSFTYNIVYYFNELNHKVLVYRNDEISINEIKKINPNYICLSPGPGGPKNSGICINIVKYFYKKIPILGVCLGHQVINEAFNGKTIKSKIIMHGKISKIFHKKEYIFKNIKNPFNAIRYNSLSIDKNKLSKSFKITAWSNNKEIMAISHKKYNVHGVQFHPESILSEYGHNILKNFLY
ncbi:putative glutamine amidotransferase of anthranilate synthase [Candidatus Zinderia insecticola CARI]|uniref:Putative glutamine amidotransferase of anthranilate synthase n=1 Tax=Zinderia insecticola (strain CARI) TaxID=871271 RepID=E0TIM1_ZINIC|nr:putative glutamine amidotransferase of anthranilate synthase [Candidatus Zinderia insecticola CARI]